MATRPATGFVPEDGYIKFQVVWDKAPAFSPETLQELGHWRQEMYRAKLIGVYPDGVGYGNISRRWDSAGRFLITGSGTGNFEQLAPEHYCLVTEVEPEKNQLSCRGPILASSESMSHAVIYRECPWVNGVIHVHHLGLWEKLLHHAPTTAADAAYGSPEMAASIVDLLRHTDLQEQKLFVMAGHREGIFVFGNTLEEAGKILNDWFD